MNLGIDNKVALVAAASRGLGKAVALELSKEGARVVICSRSTNAIEQAATDIAHQTGRDVMGIRCNVTNPDDVRALVTRAVERFGSVDILVTNAGGPPAGTVADLTADDFQKAVELNLMSTINLTYAALPHMRKAQWGRIVAITSVSARQPIEELALSNTARAGVLGFIKSVSNEFASEGITANAVCPGYTKTERTVELARMFVESGKGTEEDYYAKVNMRVPMQRMGRVDELAAAVAFLCSARASYITGVALPIDGGWVKGLY
ncbi:MAG: SDR family oxidoreductase [Candidatus Zixiibacteriota bacterium]